MHRFVILLTCLLVIFFRPAIAQHNSILGKWYFDHFGGPHGEIANSPEIVKANKQDVGFTFTFTADNKITTVQAGGVSETVNYQLLPHRQIIIQSDTMEIMLLTANILELYPTNKSKPALFLKRTKDGKTSMSAP